jgi:hypothetical protein
MHGFAIQRSVLGLWMTGMRLDLMIDLAMPWESCCHRDAGGTVYCLEFARRERHSAANPWPDTIFAILLVGG